MEKGQQISYYFSTKKDGNLAFHVGDNKDDVTLRHQALAQKLGYDYTCLVYMQQVHSNKVHIITDEDFFSPPTCDALITNKPDTPLMVMSADCSPVILFDKKKRVIAAVHAGRAGAFSNILQNTINTFMHHFHSQPQDIEVHIGAAIGVCCYEVGEEIYKEAQTLQLEYAIEKREQKYFLDIAKILQTQLSNAGVAQKNITQESCCTCCNTDTFYSYRASQKTGRFCGVVWIETKEF